jgi:hypothetical protein
MNPDKRICIIRVSFKLKNKRKGYAKTISNNYHPLSQDKQREVTLLKSKRFNKLDCENNKGHLHPVE